MEYLLFSTLINYYMLFCSCVFFSFFSQTFLTPTLSFRNISIKCLVHLATLASFSLITQPPHISVDAVNGYHMSDNLFVTV